MEITRTDRDGVVVLAISTRRVVTEDDARAFKNELTQALAEGHERIIVDLGGVPWLNSTGLGILIDAHATARQSGGRVKLCRVSQHVQRALEITRLTALLESYEDESQAAASF